MVSPMSSSSSVGNGPSPTRVVYALETPTTWSIFVGRTPDPIVTPPATGLEDVTNGYVPWSISSRKRCAPSNKIHLPLATALLNKTNVTQRYTQTSCSYPYMV